MSSLRCPVCGGDCIQDAEILLESAKTLFSPCSDCICIPLDKRLPPPGLSPSAPCPVCGKRFIDDVFSHCHLILSEEGAIDPETPLGGIGMPLISPGIAITAPPFLPRDSLVLLTRHADRRIAERIVGEVPEVKGVIADKGIVPGIPGDSLSGGDANVLLAGCDVRADIFRSSNGSFAVYKQQSLLHIEFPRGADPKIRSVESMIRKRESGVFIDACSGAGTLGITALLAGVPEVVLNDAWYPASFWSAINLHANRNLLDMDRVEVPPGYDPERWREVPCNPVETGIARGEGKRAVVLWGDFREMGDRIPEGRILAAIDIFGKSDPSKTGKIIREWEAAYGGDAFIP